MTGFVIVLHSQRYSVSDPDCHHPADGQTADRPDGGFRICGYHAGGESGVHSHAGWRDPAVFRYRADLNGVGRGAAAFRPLPAQYPAS